MREIQNLQIEISTHCNSNCIMCPIPYMKRERRFMDIGLYKKIIDDMPRAYDKSVAPFLNGEPLLNPDVLEYLRYTKMKLPMAKVGLFTNGSLIDKFHEEILKDDLLDNITFSFDGGDKESYEKVRRGLSFDKVSNNIHNFIKVRNRMGKTKPTVYISMVVVDENRDSIKKFKDNFKDADSVGIHKEFNFCIGRNKKRNRLWYFFNKQDYCQRLESSITVLVDGKVSICCFDYEGKEIIGDVKKESVMNIWYGKKMKSKIELLKKRKFESLPLCSKCNFIEHNVVSQQVIKMESILRKVGIFNMIKDVWVKSK